MSKKIKTQPSDLLDEMVERRTAKNPEFPAIYEATRRAREMIDELAATRKAKRISQATVARRMGTKQPAIARFEANGDARLSTINAYANAIGAEIRIRDAVTHLTVR